MSFDPNNIQAPLYVETRIKRLGDVILTETDGSDPGK